MYRVTEIIGTCGTSWEDAAAEAIRTAAGTIHDLRVAEVVKQDIHLDEGRAITDVFGSTVPARIVFQF